MCITECNATNVLQKQTGADLFPASQFCHKHKYQKALYLYERECNLQTGVCVCPVLMPTKPIHCIKYRPELVYAPNSEFHISNTVRISDVKTGFLSQPPAVLSKLVFYQLSKCHYYQKVLLLTWPRPKQSIGLYVLQRQTTSATFSCL